MMKTKKLVYTIFCVAVMLAVGLTTPLFAVELTKAEDFICEVTQDMSGIRITGIKTEDKNSVTKVVIPETIEGIPVTEIVDAFGGSKALVSVSIPNTVTKIGWWAFKDCSSLEAIELPASLTVIGHDAFSVCSSLKSINIPDSVTDIGTNAFEYCTSLESVTLPKSLKNLGDDSSGERGVFRRCTSLKSIVIPDPVTGIWYCAFKDCTSLESVTLPASLKTIDRLAFDRCSSLKEVIVPDGLTEIEFDYDAFMGCSSMSVKSQMALRKLGYKGSF